MFTKSDPVYPAYRFSWHLLGRVTNTWDPNDSVYPTVHYSNRTWKWNYNPKNENYGIYGTFNENMEHMGNISKKVGFMGRVWGLRYIVLRFRGAYKRFINQYIELTAAQSPFPEILGITP